MIKLNIWAKQWLVDFNPSKTKYVLFAHKSPTAFPSIVFNNTPIERVDYHKHLGVTLSHNTKWSDHIDNIVASASKMVSSMRKLKYRLNRYNLSRIYLVFIRPKLEYASAVWDNCSIYNANRLELIQLEAARVVTGLTKFSSRNSLYYETGWQPLVQRRKATRLVTMYKIINHQCPSYISDLIPPQVSQNTNYNLRNKNNSTIPYARTTTFKRSFIIESLNNWNSLSSDERNSSSISAFKSAICDIQSKTPSYFNCGNRRSNIIHTRLRHNCSSLNSDLFRVNLSESLSCTCTSSCENSFHYFLECNLYNQFRRTLFSDIIKFGGQPSLDTILLGDPNLSTKANTNIFLSVHKYIVNSKRFI